MHESAYVQGTEPVSFSKVQSPQMLHLSPVSKLQEPI